MNWAGLTLGAPWALWGLLALPALWIIHLLQRKYRPRRISTLFLLEHLQVDSWRGSRLRRLLSSRSLWLQSLALLFLVALAVHPQWRAPIQSARIAVVVDSSASMSAFQDRIPKELPGALLDWGLPLQNSEFALYASSLELGQLARGNSLESLWPDLRDLAFDGGAHDIQPSLDLAQQWVGSDGIVVFVGDQLREFPAKVLALGIGEVLDNVGFAGVQVEVQGDAWQISVMVRNFSPQAQTRQLRLEGQLEQTLQLQARELKTLTWTLASAQIWAQLTLTADAYPRDDHLTVVQPQTKILPVAVVSPGPAGTDFKAHFSQLFPMVRWDEAEGLLRVEQVDGQGPKLRVEDAEGPKSRVYHRIVFYAGAHSVTPTPLAVVGTEHELVRGLSWAPLGLSISQLGELQRLDSDEVLLWYQQEPLALLRHVVRSRSSPCLELHVNIKYADTLWQQPAFVLLLHRFVQRVLTQIPGYERRNLAVPSILQIPGYSLRELQWRWDGEASPTTMDFDLGAQSLRLGSLHQRLGLSLGQGPVADYALQVTNDLEGDFAQASRFRKVPASAPSLVSSTQTTSGNGKIFWLFLAASFLALDWHWRRKPV
jgi:hypothetical protein